MIFDKIENFERYKGLTGVYDALKWLSEQTDIPTQKAEIASEVEVFANGNEFFSKPADEIDFEAHDKYIDVHFIVEGVEGISITQRSTTTPKGEYIKERDVIFLSGEPQSTSWLNKGYFLVCFPHDAHRPGMQKDASGNIKKIVVKVLA